MVVVSSRVLASWWTNWLGLGRNAYEQRLPDLIWDEPVSAQRALLSGLFEGDGSWSLVNGGPSVVIELGTVSDELADGVLRLLGMHGIVATQRIGRTALSTKDTHWLRISGADQIERAIFLVPLRDRIGVLASIARQKKRIAPTGYRRDGNAAWVRVTGVERRPCPGHVYSMEVSGLHTFVTTGGVVVSNCFPKDVSALKQLAGNSGYPFQLLTSVIEVNELQQRRVSGKEAPGVAGGQADRPARAGVQAEHRRHARGVVAGAVGAAAGRRGQRGRIRSDRRGGGAAAAADDRARRRRARGGGGRRRGRAGHGVARVP